MTTRLLWLVIVLSHVIGYVCITVVAADVADNTIDTAESREPHTVAEAGGKCYWSMFF